jgi:glycerol-3-phosphate dehydrogenase
VSTQGLAIGGGKGYPMTPEARRAWVAERSGRHSASLVLSLLDRYGTRAEAVLADLPAQPTELEHAHGYFREELAYLARNEQVVHLIDLLLRRTDIAFVGGLSAATLEEAAAAIAEPLGWDDARVSEEIAHATQVLRDDHRIDLAQGGRLAS